MSSLEVPEEAFIPPLFPLTAASSSLLFLLPAFSLLSASSGVGGGGVIVPLLALLGGYPLSNAVALSNSVILGGAIANFIVNHPRSHPLSPLRPLISYPLIVLLQPTLILGSFYGTYINKLIPDAVTCALLVVVVGYGGVMTIKKGLKQYSDYWEKEEEREAVLRRERAGGGGGGGGKEEGGENDSAGSAEMMMDEDGIELGYR